MSNAKRFLSVILAIIMVCSTLVIGANAAYTAYKDEAILGQYNALDTAVLTTDQYASAAMDEVDRMLNEEQLKFSRDDIFVGDVDITSIDATMDSVYTLVNGTLFSSLSGMLGDLKNLSVEAFKPESAGGVRRGTPGKTDTDIIYAVLQFLYNNKGIFVNFVNGTIDLGSILPSLVDISDYTDVSKLLKGLLYEATYVDENGDSLDAPDNIGTYSFDTMVQDLIDRFVIDEFEIDDRMIGSYFEGDTNISSGTMYDFLDKAIKDVYNAIAVYALNNDLKEVINEFCGVEYLEDGTMDESNLNGREVIFNRDYTISEYSFTSATVASQINALVKNIADQLLNPELYVWVGGANSNFKSNVVNLAKAILTATGDDFFASYIEVADEAELDAMSAEELTAYALRAIINASVDEMYIPEEATTIREFGWYALTQLLATSVPTLNFSALDKNSTDSLIIMGINYAIYSISANLDMGLEYVDSMTEVDQQLAKAAQYGIDNYGGLFSGIDFTGVTGGWELIDTILFRIIDSTWIPGYNNSAAGCIFKDFLIDGLINNILDLDFDGLFGLFNYNTTSELQSTPKKVVINRIASILNTIFPGAINGNATTIDQIGANSALAGTVDAVFSTLYNERVDLVKSILPTVCLVLDLTNAQEFEFPELTYDKMVYNNSGSFTIDIDIRNSSTGINTGWKDASGNFTQDQLYTYDIKNITSSIPAIGVVTAPTEIAASTTETIHLNGPLSSTNGVLKVTVLYDVLTEDGSALTEAPIEEDIYIYLTKEATEEDAKIVSTSATNGMLLTAGQKNVFANSFGDITDITLSVANTTNAKKTVTPTSNVYTINNKLADDGKNDLAAAAGTKWFDVITDTTDILAAVDADHPGVGRVTVFEMTDAYKALSNEEKKVAWDSTVERMTTINSRTGKVSGYPKVNNYTLGITGGPSFAACNLFLFNDFGLESMVNSELNKHRQASAYSDAEAWTAYQTALEDGVKAVYSPYIANTFAGASGKASQYESASTALAAAIEALEASAKSAGVESLQAIIDQYNPDNGDLEYDDPNYNYFAVADYVDYTYYNYRDEYKAAQKMIDKATPDKETGEVAVINELDKTYMEHRLTIYGERLLVRTADKQHLAAELATLTRTAITDRNNNVDGWSAESWDNFQRALAFATSVNAITDSSLKQSKVNTALENLLEAEKRLVKDGGETPEEPTDAAYELVDPTGEGELTVIDSAEGLILTGITPGFDAEDFFDCTKCEVVLTENNSGKFSTGAVVKVYDLSGNLMETYTIARFADLNGDDDITADDLFAESGIVLGSVTVDSQAQFVAGDVANVDDDINADDLFAEAGILLGTKGINYVERCAE